MCEIGGGVFFYFYANFKKIAFPGNFLPTSFAY